MAKLVATALVLVSLGCGSGANEVAPPGARTAQGIVVDSPCTNTPESCGVRVCEDCTANAPLGFVAGCVRGICDFRCGAAGFHSCGRDCVPQDQSSCGPTCAQCGAPPGGSPICVSGSCDFTCIEGFEKIGGACVSLSLSISY
jgi:hypothetical protein